MTDQRKDLGETNDFAAVAGLVPLAGKLVVDVGCGPGHSSRQIAAAGAQVLGVEPDPVQAEKNRQSDPVERLTFVEGGAQALPLADGVADAVFFFRSLHHVPIALMDQALAEAARVLKPGTGVLAVVEPGMTGSNFRLMRPFHDETEVRIAAQAALQRIPAELFGPAESYGFVQYARHPDFAAMADRAVGLTFNQIRRDQVETDEVRALFEAGRSDQGDYVFDQPMLIDLYHRAG